VREQGVGARRVLPPNQGVAEPVSFRHYLGRVRGFISEAFRLGRAGRGSRQGSGGDGVGSEQPGSRDPPEHADGRRTLVRQHALRKLKTFAPRLR